MKAHSITTGRFGKWTVLGPAVRVGARLLNPCRCDCGTERLVAATKLVIGRSKSCGCVLPKRDLPAAPGKLFSYELTGLRFGNLVVLERCATPSRRGLVRWLCLCDCGEQCSTESERLVNGRTKSCGCRQRTRWSPSRPATRDGSLENYVPEPNTGCWLWLGCTNDRGYGMVTKRICGEVLAHRFFWAEHRGPIPGGQLVCHSCDTPSCVNPGHLFLGTQFENMRDMRHKGRGFWQRRASLQETT